MGAWVLAVEVGVTSVTAAARDGHRVEVISLADQEAFPAAVFLSEGSVMLTGPQAQTQAQADPGHAILSPRRALEGGDSVTVAGQAVPLSAIYAAIFDRVAFEASRVRDRSALGGLVLPCPPWWTGREFAVMRAAAEQAGLPAPEIISAPLAAALSLAPDVGPGQHVALVAIDGNEIDTAVLRRTADGFELAGAPGRTSGPQGDDPGELASQGAHELLATVTSAGLAPDQLAAIYLTDQEDATAPAAAQVIAVLAIEPRLNPGSRTAAVRGALAEPAARPPAANSIRPARTSRWRKTARRAPRPRLRTAAAAALAIVLAVSAGVGIWLVHSGQRNGGSRRLGTVASSLSVQQRTIKLARGAPDSFTATARYPVVSGLPPAAQGLVNSALRLPASQAIAGFAKETGQCPANLIPASNCGFVGVNYQLYRVGHLLSVKYFTETHFSGAADVSYALQAVTFRTDTGAVLGPSAILTTAALTTTGRKQLAVDLQAQPSISSCDQQPGWLGESGISPALATLATSRQPDVIINMTPGGVQFSFGDDVLSGTACQPAGTLPLTELPGLINPAIINLAASQSARHAGRGGAQPTSGVIAPHLLASLPINAPVAAMAFTPNGKTLAVQLGTGIIQLRDPVTGTVRSSVRPTGRLDDDDSDMMAVSPNGTVIALGVTGNTSNSSTVDLISVTTGKVTATIPISSPAVLSLAFSPDGKTLAIAGGRSLFTLNLATRALIGISTDKYSFTGDSRYVSGSADSKFLAVANNVGLVKLWDVQAAEFTKSVTVHSAQGTSSSVVQAVTFSPDGSMVAVSGALESDDNGTTVDAQETWLWRPSTGQVRPLQPTSIQEGGSDDIEAQAFSPDSKLIATGDDVGVIRIWDTASGELIATEHAPSNISAVPSVAFAPDGNALVTAQSDGGSTTLQLWSLHPTAEGSARQYAATGNGVWSSSPAGRTSPALRPGIYQVGRVMEVEGSWVIKLDSVEVADNGKATFIVSSENTSTVEGQLSCAASPNPPAAAITLATGQVLNSVATYCPGYSDYESIGVPANGSLKSDTVFASSHGLGRAFSFDWNGPDGLAGELSDIILSK